MEQRGKEILVLLQPQFQYLMLQVMVLLQLLNMRNFYAAVP
jgi:hypothetical protein